MLSRSELELLEGANPVSLETAETLAVAMQLSDRVFASVEDRGAVHATAGQERHLVRRRWLLAAALIAALVVVPLVAARVHDLFWDDGTPVEESSLSADDQSLLESLTPGGARITKIADDGLISFYLLRKADGDMCIADGRTGDRPSIGSIGCTSASALREQLPTPRHPLYVEVGGTFDPVTRRETDISIVGLADTGITQVQMFTADGTRVASAPVHDHVFELPKLAITPPVILRAINLKGVSVYEKKIN